MIDFTNIQRTALSAVGALVLATVFVGTAVAPAQASPVVAPVR